MRVCVFITTADLEGSVDLSKVSSELGGFGACFLLRVRDGEELDDSEDGMGELGMQDSVQVAYAETHCAVLSSKEY